MGRSSDWPDGGASGQHDQIELVVISTAGDRLGDIPLAEIGGQGVFVKEVQAAVLDGRADLAVHSAKDLPAAPVGGLTLACAPERADARDALVGLALAEMPPGSAVATGSARRRAQLAWLRPDLTFVELRGNMATRIRRSREIGSGVVAFAALDRLGLRHEATEILSEDIMLPQVGQGALAIECREEDVEILELLSGIDDRRVHRELTAERAFLAGIGGGCSVPVAGRARVDDRTGHITMEVMVARRDGSALLRIEGSGDDPEKLGASLSYELLDRRGGRFLVDW